MNELDALKQAQRKMATQNRKNLFCDKSGKHAAEIFLDNVPLRENVKISLYWPMGSELDTRPLMLSLEKKRLTCMLPVVKNKAEALIFRHWHSGDLLVEDEYGLAIPEGTSKEDIPDVIVAPLLAFDRAGYRMGYGGGFYDRTLEKIRASKKCLAIGFAYSEQEIDRVVVGPHDQKLDWIITEKSARKIS